MNSIKETVKNIINRDVGTKVYDRKTKEVRPERMPLKDYLENEILYSKPIEAIDKTATLRKLFKDEAIHEGHRYNKPESAKKIPAFIEFFELDMSQFKKEKAEDYETFNDFFTREIKPERRPISDPDDDSILVSAADSRLTVFDSLDECKNLWIKGKPFTFEGLLGGDHELAECFRGGMVANFNLAPQDYHRYHAPLAGRIIKVVNISGDHLSVYPKGIESDINTLERNQRAVLVIQTEKWGKVCYVPIGGECVGKVSLFVEEGQELKKGDEIGYFSYGGSDIVALFEHQLDWDEDIKEQSKQAIETVVHFGERIGKFRKN